MALPRSPHHSQDSTRAPPHLPSNPLQVHHQASGHDLHQSLPRQNVLEQPRLWSAATAGISSGPEAPTCMTEPAADSEQHSQMSSTPSSHKKSTAKRNSPAGQELDIQPGGEHSCLHHSFFHLYSPMFISVCSWSALLCRWQRQHHRVQAGEQEEERKIQTHLLRGRTTQLFRVRQTLVSSQFSTTAQEVVLVLFYLHKQASFSK